MISTMVPASVLWFLPVYYGSCQCTMVPVINCLQKNNGGPKSFRFKLLTGSVIESEWLYAVDRSQIPEAGTRGDQVTAKFIGTPWCFYCRVWKALEDVIPYGIFHKVAICSCRLKRKITQTICKWVTTDACSTFVSYSRPGRNYTAGTAVITYWSRVFGKLVRILRPKA